MKRKLTKNQRAILGFVILCLCTVLILYTGPGFNFALQVVLASMLMFFLFWLVT
ncbi:MAG: hypothetical protein HY579_10425 [Nitrospinae bacterium]|nr:hypothetical protein [Nitrospinota bacterium]